jgi:hypothetical protein
MDSYHPEGTIITDSQEELKRIRNGGWRAASSAQNANSGKRRLDNWGTRLPVRVNECDSCNVAFRNASNDWSGLSK